MLVATPRSDYEKSLEFPSFHWKLSGYISSEGEVTVSHEGEHFSMVYSDVWDAIRFCKNRGYAVVIKWS